MAKYSPIGLVPDVAARARRLAKHNNMPVGAYVGELIDKAHAETFGEAAAPLISVAVDENGGPAAYTVEAEQPFNIPANLAGAFVSHVTRIATDGGAMLDFVDDESGIVRVERRGPAILVAVTVDGVTTNTSFGAHRALQIARQLRDMIDVMEDTASARASRPAA